MKDGTALSEGGNISGAQTPTLTLSSVFGGDAGGYSVIVSNTYGSVTSLVATLSVEDPFINTQPASQSVNARETALFSVDAVGTSPLSYQWFKDGVSLTDGGNIFGAQTATLTLSNVLGGDWGGYSVVISNAFGSVTSMVATLSVVGDPFIITQPANQTTSLDSNVTFSVVAGGTSPLSYQWQHNGANLADNIRISGSQLPILAIAHVQAGDAGDYRLVLTNAFGAVNSLTATLNVVFPPVVTDCTEAVLRGAMAGGGTVTFTCDGTITLSNTIAIDKDTILDGSGHEITISGNDACRVFFVNNNVNFTLINLTIAHGLGTNGNYGGGIYNDGTVNATNCIFFNNCAYGFSAPPYLSPPGTGGDGYGGAIYNTGIFTASQCSFLQNSADGGVGTCFPVQPSFHPWGNGRFGGPGGTGGGGAICNLGILAIDRSLFASNTASGGNGGTGEGAWAGVGMPYISPGGAGGSGGSGAGGVLFNVGTADLANCTFAWNQSVGGNGGEGGEPASFYWEGRTYQAPGGGSGSDGYGLGGIYNTNGTFNLINCTLAFNSSSNGSVAGGGIVTAGLGRLINTLLASNTPTNCSGVITDAGHNLSSDGSCAFSNIGSLNNTDPLLGPLADNGGPTLTMALLPGSPAIDAGDTAAAPPTDQRGFPRPVGSAADIGAYECSPPVIAALEPSQTTEMGDTLDLWASVSDPAPLYYQWFCNGNAIAGCTNRVLCLSGVQATNAGTYSVIVSNIFGAVTSSPAILNVIPMVERRGVPAINLMGETGSSLNVEFTGALDSPANWLPLDTVSLTSTTQYYFDLTSPLPSQRFYRTRQLGTPSVVSSLSLPGMVPAITLTGTVGSSVRVDCINQFGPTDAWVTLDTVTLTNTSQLYFDVSAIGQPARLWRIVPVP